MAGLALVAPGSSSAPAAASDGLWTEISSASPAPDRSPPADSHSGRFRAYRVALAALHERLAQAPPETARTPAAPEITLPLPDGRLERFRVVVSSFLGGKFRAAHPDLQSYLAFGQDDFALQARLDFTPHGVRAIIFTRDGVALLDPLEPGSVDAVRSYWTRDGADGPFQCQVLQSRLGSPLPAPAHAAATGDLRRTLRFVLMGTGEYTGALGGVSEATAEMVTSVDRLDAIFQREAAVRLELVGAMAYADSTTDPYPLNSINDLVVRNTNVVSSVFGHDAFDLAQVVSQQGGPYPSGGAFESVLCDGEDKGGSAVIGPDPGANWYMLKVMAHEIAHMLGALHTQDADCQRAPSSAYEPGSGTTIMSYAGKCPPYDVEPWADPYFHVASLEQMATVLAAHPLCGSADATGNSVPVANAGADYTIPRQTPFVLAGGGFDPDPWDTLTYCWEEFDKAPTSGDPVSGPLFRSRPPSTTAGRAFPALAAVLSGGPAPYEELPAVDRALRFRLTVRDNHPGTGGWAWDEATVTASGPRFVVTSPNGGESYASGELIPVTWEVGGGSVAQTVDILVSTDGGQSWNLLVANTPNDGSQGVYYHVAQTSTNCRIKVQAVGNIFYDVSNSDFTVAGSVTDVSRDQRAPVTLALGPATPSPSRGRVTVDFDLADDATLDLAVFSVQGRRLRTLASGAWPAGHHQLVWDGSDQSGRRLPAGAYFVRGVAAGEVRQRRAVLLR